MSTLVNAMEVLKLIVRLRRDVTVTDLVNELGYPKSSASRTLSQMAEHEFLERDALTKAYRPGAVIMEASFHFRASTTVAALLEDALEKLVADTGCTGYLGILKESDILVVQMRPGHSALQVYTPPGSSAPAFANSMGRALLARHDDAEVRKLVGRKLAAPPARAPQTPQELLERLAQVRRLGFAESRGEVLPHVAGVAAAIVDPATGQGHGIGIAMPEQDSTDAAFARYALCVRDAAQSVGRRIGDDYWLRFQP
ncbi:IclR family transcriptional regulator [Pelomonas sp. KK5]|uniref:IclR family transcriptional regulator n=1 Tax=Pelomonas sp. KK5 TaxID=1855730 RepID=UPI00097BBB1A|nr:IclR family transcriptional regulator [Pelomonas sp. KK5]